MLKNCSHQDLIQQMYVDNISFAMCSLLFNAPSKVLLCQKLVGCPTGNSQVHAFSNDIFLPSVHVQLYPITGKICKIKLYTLGC